MITSLEELWEPFKFVDFSSEECGEEENASLIILVGPPTFAYKIQNF